jgi:hypothetical protein
VAVSFCATGVSFVPPTSTVAVLEAVPPFRR